MLRIFDFIHELLQRPDVITTLLIGVVVGKRLELLELIGLDG